MGMLGFWKSSIQHTNKLDSPNQQTWRMAYFLLDIDLFVLGEDCFGK